MASAVFSFFKKRRKRYSELLSFGDFREGILESGERRRASLVSQKHPGLWGLERGEGMDQQP